MLKPLSLVALLALGACGAPPVPDSGSGVGFGDYAEYERAKARREAQLHGDVSGGPAVQVGRTAVISAGQGRGGFHGDAILADSDEEDEASREGAVILPEDLAAAGIGTYGEDFSQ